MRHAGDLEHDFIEVPFVAGLIPHLTRSSLHRCLQRHGIGRLQQIEGGKPTKSKFKAYLLGFFHIDIAEVQTAEGKLYLFVGIDRTGKFAFVQLADQATCVTASCFLEALIAAVPHKIYTVLTDNGIQFHFAPRYADGPTAASRCTCLRCAAGNPTSSIAPRSIIPGRTVGSNG